LRVRTLSCFPRSQNLAWRLQPARAPCRSHMCLV
jgi:hypothetical protein